MQRKDREAQSAAAQRIRAAWRMRACAAGMAAGAQVFLLGTGVARPLCLNAAWIAGLAAVPASALSAAACRQTLAHRRSKKLCRWLHGLLALSFSLDAAFAAAALASLAEQSLLPQTPAVHSLLMTCVAIAACVLPGSTGCVRLAFALRFALPVLLALLCVPVLAPAGGRGLFPILGTGTAQAFLGAGVMLGAAFPALMLLYPPPEIRDMTDWEAYAVPDAAFFVRRVLLGAACGAALLLAVTLGGTYESMAAQHTWGERLMIAAGSRPSAGLPQTGIVLLQILSIALLAANMLLAGMQAAQCAFAACRGNWQARVFCGAVFACAAAALLITGFDAALLCTPVLLAALGLALLFHRRLGGGDEDET